MLPPLPALSRTPILSWLHQKSPLNTFNSGFQDIPSCPGAVSPEKSPFCGGCWHRPGEEAMGMQLPKVILKVKAAVGGSWGPLGVVQPRWGGYFLLTSFCSPQNWAPPGLGDGEELEVPVCAGWLWGKLRQLHPCIPPGTIPGGGSSQKKPPKKVMFRMRKTFEGAAGGRRVSPGPCQVGKLRQGAPWLSRVLPPPFISL